MTKAKKLKPIIAEPEPIPDPEPPVVEPPELRQFALPFSGANHAFYSMCANRLGPSESVLFDGKQWKVNYATFDRRENKFFISLTKFNDLA
jgi:hypothetical protein